MLIPRNAPPPEVERRPTRLTLSLYQPLVEDEDYHNSSQHYNVILGSSSSTSTTLTEDYLNSSGNNEV